MQFGFKKNSSCSHALFTLTETVKYFTKKDSRVHCAFLNASKAFDKVLHNGLFLKLLKIGVPVVFCASVTKLVQPTTLLCKVE